MTSKKLSNIAEADSRYLFGNYGKRRDVCFVRGKGSLLYDQDGKEYIDLFAGIAVSGLGYGHPAYVKAVSKQIKELIHSSNLFYNREQAKAGMLLSQISFPGRSFFCNSGAEANEAAIKLARRYGLSINKRKYRILSFTNSFHGRTFGSMTATGQKKIHGGFGPLPEGFDYLPFNDIAALRKAMRGGKRIAAVITELIQGEGGVIPAKQSFVSELARLCKEHSVLLIVDEVQTGVGRTGRAFAYQHYGIEPDIITLAKALGGGIPIGAMHAKEFLNAFLPAGSHGTTFGGNHLACTAACSVMEEIQKPSFIKNTAKTGELMLKMLLEMKNELPVIKDVRGLGLLFGIELNVPGSGVVDAALKNGLIVNCTAGNVIRLAPPLNISAALAEKGLKILRQILSETKAGEQ